VLPEALALAELVLVLVLVPELELVHPVVAARPAATTMAPSLEALQML
jgi:hypothetical protein